MRLCKCAIARVCAVRVAGSLYNAFSAGGVEADKRLGFFFADKSIADTWAEILAHWLPNSQYEYDEARVEFEAYDERDHAWPHDNTPQTDICVPIRERM
jgi:hypothetical protein